MYFNRYGQYAMDKDELSDIDPNEGFKEKEQVLGKTSIKDYEQLFVHRDDKKEGSDVKQRNTKQTNPEKLLFILKPLRTSLKDLLKNKNYVLLLFASALIMQDYYFLPVVI